VLYQSSKFCLRKYDRMCVAVVEDSRSSDNDNDDLQELLKYLGVSGSPENAVGDQGSKSIRFTAPVLTQESIGGKSVAVVLPAELKSVSDAPSPLSSRVTIKDTPARIVAVKSFSGFAGSEESAAVARRFYRDLVVDHISQFIAQRMLRRAEAGSSTSRGRPNNLDSISWEVARFSPSSTLPFMRRNEVWIEMDSSQLQSLLQQLKKT